MHGYFIVATNISVRYKIWRYAVLQRFRYPVPPDNGCISVATKISVPCTFFIWFFSKVICIKTGVSILPSTLRERTTIFYPPPQEGMGEVRDLRRYSLKNRINPFIDISIRCTFYQWLFIGCYKDYGTLCYKIWRYTVPFFPKMICFEKVVSLRPTDIALCVIPLACNYLPRSFGERLMAPSL